MKTEVLFLLLLLGSYQRRLLDGVKVEKKTGCWLWTKSDDGRYGHITLNGTRFKAHVAAALLWRGLRLRTRVLMHQCDTPACCNPDHLVPGTQSQNRQEACERGRAVGTTKRTAARIRRLVTLGHTYAEAARRTNVHATTAMRIAKGESR